MTSAYSINLNFNNTVPVKTDFTFKQGDKGITLNLATTGLDTTGTTAHIVFKRSNGTSVEAELTGQTGPSYSYTILGNEFEIPGVVVADLKLYNGDTQRVSTASFIFLVTGDTMDGVGGGTGGYSDQLEQLSQEFAKTLEEYQDAFGDVGAINPRGEYSALEEYTVLDLVSYQGSSYLCREGCTGIVPTNTTYWQVFASGGGGGTDDYEDLENKPSINGVELSGDKSTGDLGIEFNDLDDVDMTGATDGQVPTWDATTQKYKPGTPAAGGGTNPNLLINPWFTVNQRGWTSGSSTNTAFCVDRWRMTYRSTAGTVAVTSSGLKLTPYSGDRVTLYQGFESVSDLVGRSVTMSIKLSDGTIYQGTVASFDSTTTTTFYEANNIKLVYNKNDTDFRVEVIAEKTIRAVKLEIGSKSTLDLDTEPDYSTELLKCQRYYWQLDFGATQQIGFMVNLSSTLSRGPLNFPTKMRAIPTVSITGSFKLNDASTDVTISDLSTSSLGTLRVFLNATCSGATAGHAAILVATSSATIAFSAEL